MHPGNMLFWYFVGVNVKLYFMFLTIGEGFVSSKIRLFFLFQDKVDILIWRNGFGGLDYYQVSYLFPLSLCVNLQKADCLKRFFIPFPKKKCPCNHIYDKLFWYAIFQILHLVFRALCRITSFSFISGQMQWDCICPASRSS